MRRALVCSFLALVLAHTASRAGAGRRVPGPIGEFEAPWSEKSPESECLSSAGRAAGGALLWIGCIGAVALTGGASLVPCFAMGIGAYFTALQAAADCIEECPTCGGGGDEGELPECDDPDLEPGDPCLCSCPGEPCCDWPDAP